MAAYSWTGARDAVVARLSLVTSDDRTIGFAIRDALNELGTAYDGAYSPSVDAARVDADAQYASALASWNAGAQSSHDQADEAARYLEQIQLDADATVEGIILAPAKSIAFDLTVPPVAATRTLVAGAAPALRVVSKVAGAYGNAIEVSVSVRIDGYGYALLARLGPSYVESFQAGTGQSPPVTASKLLASATLVQGAVRPDNAGFAALSGGVGASLINVEARLDAAAKLPALTVAQRFLATEHRRLVALAHGPKPSSSSFGNRELATYNKDHGALEGQLAEQVARADAWLLQTA